MATPLSPSLSNDGQTSGGRVPIIGLHPAPGEKNASGGAVNEVNPEALTALDTYKARDTSKGMSRLFTMFIKLAERTKYLLI